MIIGSNVTVGAPRECGDCRRFLPSPLPLPLLLIFALSRGFRLHRKRLEKERKRLLRRLLILSQKQLVNGTQYAALSNYIYPTNFYPTSSGRTELKNANGYVIALRHRTCAQAHAHLK